MIVDSDKDEIITCNETSDLINLEVLIFGTFPLLIESEPKDNV